MSRLIYKSGLGLFFFPYRTTNSFWIFVRIASVRRFKQISKIYVSLKYWIRGWSGGAKVLCVLHHQGDQLILAYSWTRPAIFVAGKGRGGMFFISSVSSLSFLFLFLPCPSLSSFYYLFYLYSLSLGDGTKWPTRVDVSLNPNTINQSKYWIQYSCIICD